MSIIRSSSSTIIITIINIITIISISTIMTSTTSIAIITSITITIAARYESRHRPGRPLRQDSPSRAQLCQYVIIYQFQLCQLCQYVNYGIMHIL